MKSFDEINVIPFAIITVYLLYKLYKCYKKEGYSNAAIYGAHDEKNKLLKSSFEGMVRGFTMGVMTGGLESGLAYGTLLSILNPFIDTFNTIPHFR